MSKGAKCSTRTITRLLHIITFWWFIYFRMKLLFGTGMTINTSISIFTTRWFTPFISMFHTRTGCWSEWKYNKNVKNIVIFLEMIKLNINLPVFIYSRITPLISYIMKMRTSISLTTKSWGSFTSFRFIKCKNKCCIWNRSY